MGRRYTVDDFEEVVSSVRAAWPRVAITTDVIVGFPGETEVEFEETLATCRRVGFSRVHVFRYSPRSGTPAAAMVPIDAHVVAERAARLRQLAEELAHEYEETLKNQQLEVVVERVVGEVAHVRSREYLSYTVPLGEFERRGVTVAEGSIVELPLADLLRDGVGLE